MNLTKELLDAASALLKDGIIHSAVVDGMTMGRNDIAQAIAEGLAAAANSATVTVTSGSMPPPVPSVGPGSMACAEVLHMTQFFASAVETQIAEHPSVSGDPDWLKLANDAVMALNALYQDIVGKHIAA